MFFIAPKIIFVKPLDNYEFYVEFKDGQKRIYDMKPDLDLPCYQKLTKNNYFYKIHIEHGIAAWDDMCDVAPHKIYLEGKIVEEEPK